MAISIKTDLEFGQVFYLKADSEQMEHLLVGVVIMPGKQFKFKLSFCGEVSEVWDFECSTEKDISKDIIDKEED